HHRLDYLDREDELADQAGRAPVAAARPDQPELLDVARYGGLRCAHAAASERRRDLVLRVDRTPVDQLEDRAVALGLGGRHPATFCITACALSISSAVMISGGTSRTERSSTASTMRPASSHDSR